MMINFEEWWNDKIFMKTKISIYIIISEPEMDFFRLTFDVLQPFKLEQSRAVSNYVFNLKPNIHQALVNR